MLPPKLGHILGCLALTEIFLPKIKPYPGQITFWKYNEKSIFLTFLSIDQNSLKKIYNGNKAFLVWNLLWESIFNFGKWSNGKYTNRCICVFSIWSLPEVKNLFRKQISNENCHISILKLLRVLVNTLKSQKLIPPLYFQKVIQPE